MGDECTACRSIHALPSARRSIIAGDKARGRWVRVTVERAVQIVEDMATRPCECRCHRG